MTIRNTGTLDIPAGTDIKIEVTLDYLNSYQTNTSSYTDGSVKSLLSKSPDGTKTYNTASKTQHYTFKLPRDLRAPQGKALGDFIELPLRDSIFIMDLRQDNAKFRVRALAYIVLADGQKAKFAPETTAMLEVTNKQDPTLGKLTFVDKSPNTQKQTEIKEKSTPADQLRYTYTNPGPVNVKHSLTGMAQGNSYQLISLKGRLEQQTSSGTKTALPINNVAQSGNGYDIVGVGVLGLVAKFDNTGCTDTLAVEIRQDGLDLLIDGLAMQDDFCFGTLPSAEEVRVVLKNSGTMIYANQPESILTPEKAAKYALNFEAELFQKDGQKVAGVDKLTKHYSTRDAIFNSVRASGNGEEWPYSIDTVTGRNAVTLPLGSINLSSLQQGEYTLKVSFKTADSRETQEYEGNNTAEYSIVVHASPRVEFVNADNSISFYKDAGKIALKLESLKEQKIRTVHAWTKDGQEFATNERGEAEVHDAGQYTIQYVDAYGCLGSTQATVRFPGYVVLTKPAHYTPKAECSYSAMEIVPPYIMNAGREPITFDPTGKFTVRIDRTIDGTVTEHETAKTYKVSTTAIELQPGQAAVSVPFAADMPQDFTKGIDKDGEYAFIYELREENTGVDAQAIAEGRTDFASTDLVQAYTLINKTSPLAPDIVAQVKDHVTKDGSKIADVELIPFDQYRGDVVIDAMQVAQRITDQFTYQWYLDGELLDPETQGDFFVQKTFVQPDGSEITKTVDSQLRFKKNGVYQVRVEVEGCPNKSADVHLMYVPTMQFRVEYGDIADIQKCADHVNERKHFAIRLTLLEATEPLGGPGQSITVTPNATGIALENKTLQVPNPRVVGEEIVVDLGELELQQGTSYAFAPNIVVTARKNTQLNQTIDPLSIRYSVRPKLQLSIPNEGHYKHALDLVPSIEPEGVYQYVWMLDGQPRTEITQPRWTIAESGTVYFKVTDNLGCQSFVERKVSRRADLLVKVIDTEGEDIPREAYQLAVTQFGDRVSGSDIQYNTPFKIDLKVLDTRYQNLVLYVNDTETNDYSAVSENHYSWENRKEGEELRFKFEFEKKEGGVNPVEDALLADVTLAQPFTNWLRLFNTRHVARYEVYNILGAQMLAGENGAGLDQIVLQADGLPQGLYLVKLISTQGGVKTLKAIKVR